MARIRLLPGYSPLSVEQNFQRIENMSEATLDLDQGRVLVTGSIVVTTRLSRVDRIALTLGVTPVAGACFIAGYPYSLAAGPPNQIVIAVYTNAFVASVIATAIEWTAIGEVVLG